MATMNQGSSLTRQHLLDRITDGLTQQFKGANYLNEPLTRDDIPQAEQAINKVVENVRQQVTGGKQQ